MTNDSQLQKDPLWHSDKVKRKKMPKKNEINDKQLKQWCDFESNNSSIVMLVVDAEHYNLWNLNTHSSCASGAFKYWKRTSQNRVGWVVHQNPPASLNQTWKVLITWNTLLTISALLYGCSLRETRIQTRGSPVFHCKMVWDHIIRSYEENGLVGTSRNVVQFV